MESEQDNVKGINLLKKSQETSESDEYPIHLEKGLIRPCERYEDEYNECKSAKSRRQQVFVYGEIQDCEDWARDLANCQKWAWQGDELAANAIIQSERKRLQGRLLPHIQNKVWSKRDHPPENWNAPLPEFEEINKNSYLTLIRDQGEDAAKLTSYCSIQ